jgi:hypothetical protein
MFLFGIMKESSIVVPSANPSSDLRSAFKVYMSLMYMYYNITNTALTIHEKFFSNVLIFLDIQIVKTV